ncbi:MAG: hypothetical protein ACP6IP_04275 [Candidatus Njordarchaeia archaeon]
MGIIEILDIIWDWANKDFDRFCLDPVRFLKEVFTIKGVGAEIIDGNSASSVFVVEDEGYDLYFSGRWRFDFGNSQGIFDIWFGLDLSGGLVIRMVPVVGDFAF